MPDKTIHFSIPLDDDGFVTLQCPFCNKHFKISGADAEDETNFELFCPYCGLVTGPNNFLSDEVKEKALRLVENYLYEMLNGFTDNIDKMFKKNDFIKVKKSSKFEMNSPKIIVESDNMETYKLPCCERKIKASLIDDNMYCPFCGGETYGNLDG